MTLHPINVGSNASSGQATRVSEEAYINQVLLLELREVLKVEAPMLLLTGILQGIEGLGALLDDKPLKAKGQGGKRFGLALRKLFPNEYAKADRQFDLYGRLRNHLAHVRLTANGFSITKNKEKHLQFQNFTLFIHPATFFHDFEMACIKMVNISQSKERKGKKISTQMLDGL